MFGHPNKVIHIGNVNCDGIETNINQCPVQHYSISVGKNMTRTDNIGVAGVICHIDVSTTTTSATPSTSARPATTITTTSARQATITTTTTSARQATTITTSLSPSNTRTVSNISTDGTSVLMTVVLSLLCFVIILMR